MADIEKQGRRRRRRVEEEIEETDAVAEDEGDGEGEDEVEAVRGVTAAKGRATPGRRNTQEVEAVGSPITRPFSGLQEYFRGVQGELDKVTWPTREETIRLSRIVLIVTIITSILLGVISLGFTLLFQGGLSNPIIFLAFFVVVGIVVFGYRRYSRARASTEASANYNSRLF
jgi:preprotein translocase subunit SecE